MGGTSSTTNWALVFSESVRRWSAVSWLEVALAFAFIGIVSAYSWIQSVKRKLPLPYPGKRGVVQCSCGKCKLTLRNYEPRFRLECNCFDCRKRMEWSKSLGCQYLANKHYSGLFDGECFCVFVILHLCSPSVLSAPYAPALSPHRAQCRSARKLTRESPTACL